MASLVNPLGETYMYAKMRQLKTIKYESLSFFGDMESLEPSKFEPYQLLIACIVSEL